MLKKIKYWLVRLDHHLDKQIPIFLNLVLLLVLRIPNFFEPYWYGDEGIYLTIGQTLNKGFKLYADIIDHKTPIIYYLARVQTQLNFRILNTFWMLVTTTAFYYFTLKLLKSTKQAGLSTLIFVLLTTLPALEGNIPNGELFVLGFVLVGAWILTHTSYFKQFITSKVVVSKTKDYSLLFLSGVFFGLGILTKVPAILDLGAFLVIAYFNFLTGFQKGKIKTNLNLLKLQFFNLSVIILGVITPIIFSIIYFIKIGAGQAYLDFGLMYNFRYAGSWHLPFENKLLQFLFTLQGKVLLIAVFMLLLSLAHRRLQAKLKFITTWFVLTLFASSLSNRPYPHYFIQVVPSLALVITLGGSELIKIIKNSKKKAIHLVNFSIYTVLIALIITVGVLLHFAPYQTVKYYQNWFKLITKQISLTDYYQSFDSLMTDNYKAGKIIKKSGTKDLFIWGTNPTLYALTETKPSGRFTVSFHIKDFDAYQETADSVITQQPLFIVTMNNENHPFSELRPYIYQNYTPNITQFDHFILWKRNRVMQDE